MVSVVTAFVQGLRDTRDIDDTVLRRVRAEFDAEEVRLTGLFDD